MTDTSSTSCVRRQGLRRKPSRPRVQPATSATNTNVTNPQMELAATMLKTMSIAAVARELNISRRALSKLKKEGKGKTMTRGEALMQVLHRLRNTEQEPDLNLPKRRCCKYPVSGEKTPYEWCNAPCIGSYCKEHYSLAHSGKKPINVFIPNRERN